MFHRRKNRWSQQVSRTSSDFFLCLFVNCFQFAKSATLIILQMFQHFIVYSFHRLFMKVVYPKNIKKWLLAWLTFQIGPISLSIIQLFLLAIGVAAAMWAFNAFRRTSQAFGIAIAVVILIIFIIIAFFNISELGLIAFIAKMVRNNFFDTTKKFQINYEKHNPTEIKIKEVRSEEEKAVIESKESGFDKEKLKDIERGWLI